jgi:hypothetical protein
MLNAIAKWIGTHLPGRWRWHSFEEAEAFLNSLDD